MIHFTNVQTFPKIPKKCLNPKKCKSSNLRTKSLKVGALVPAPPSIVTNLLYREKTRRSDIVTEQERSLAISTRPRPSHVIRKAKSVRATAFQARRY